MSGRRSSRPDTDEIRPFGGTPSGMSKLLSPRAERHPEPIRAFERHWSEEGSRLSGCLLPTRSNAPPGRPTLCGRVGVRSRDELVLKLESSLARVRELQLVQSPRDRPAHERKPESHASWLLHVVVATKKVPHFVLLSQKYGTLSEKKNIEVAEIVQYPILVWMGGRPWAEYHRLWIQRQLRSTEPGRDGSTRTKSVHSRHASPRLGRIGR